MLLLLVYKHKIDSSANVRIEPNGENVSDLPFDLLGSRLGELFELRFDEVVIVELALLFK